MKRVALLAAVVVAVSVSQGALAADLAAQAAPPPAPAPTWTGLYVGVHAGAAWQSSPNWTVTDAKFIPGVMGLAPQTLTGNRGWAVLAVSSSGTIGNLLPLGWSVLKAISLGHP